MLSRMHTEPSPVSLIYPLWDLEMIIFGGLNLTMSKNKFNSFFVWVLLTAILITGCGLGETEHQLINGYSIWEDYGSQCCIINRNGKDNTPSNFYITGYAISDFYVAIEGIPTAYLYAEQKELQTDVRKYYLINTLSNEVYGVFDSKLQLEYQFEEMSITFNGEWVCLYSRGE